MGKKAGTVKAKKGSKAQGDKVKTAAEQEKTAVAETPVPPNRMQNFLQLVKGGGKSRPEAAQKGPAVPGKGKETAPKVVRKESGKPRGQFIQDSVKFLQSAWAELKKVHWPTRSELVVYTAVVIGSVVIVAALIWIVDSILSLLLNYIL
ncbi:MAG: preprotein translocase subunit SecE [Thermacetogeniaceae bacterium]